jgi:hypothetical protein
MKHLLLLLLCMSLLLCACQADPQPTAPSAVPTTVPTTVPDTTPSLPETTPTTVPTVPETEAPEETDTLWYLQPDGTLRSGRYIAFPADGVRLPRGCSGVRRVIEGREYVIFPG